MVFAGTPVARASWPTVNGRSMAVPPVRCLCTERYTFHSLEGQGEAAKKITTITNASRTLRPRVFSASTLYCQRRVAQFADCPPHHLHCPLQRQDSHDGGNEDVRPPR